MSSTCGRRMAEEAALRNTPKSFMGPPEDCHSATHGERKGSDHNGDDLLSDRARSPLCCTMGVAKGKQGRVGKIRAVGQVPPCLGVREWVERIGRSDVNAISTPIRLGEGSICSREKESHDQGHV